MTEKYSLLLTKDFRMVMPKNILWILQESTKDMKAEY